MEGHRHGQALKTTTQEELGHQVQPSPFHPYPPYACAYVPAYRAFRDWLDSIAAQVDPIPAGTFKESGTSIATCLITINKPKGAKNSPAILA